jgi:hypothetical protein
MKSTYPAPQSKSKKQYSTQTSRSFKIRVASLLGAVFLVGLPAAQGSITWGAPANISGPSNVLGGAVVDTCNFSGGSLTVNTVAFSNCQQPDATSVTTGNVTVSTPGPFNVVDNTSAFTGSMPGTYGTLLGAADYVSGDGGSPVFAGLVAQPMTVTIGGLTSGAGYEIAIWVNDSRDFPGGYDAQTRFETVDLGTTLQFQEPSTGNGQYVYGTFVAPVSGSVSFTLQGYDSASSDVFAVSQLNGLEVVQTTPEPASMVLIGLGGVGLGLFRRVRRAQRK